MDSNYETVIHNKRIYEYYKSNPNISIETMNLILLDFMEKMSTDMTSLMQNTFQGQLMTEMKDVKHLLTKTDTPFGQLILDVKDIKLTMSDLKDSIFITLQEHNKNFLETTRLVISSSNNESIEKITSLLNHTTDNYIERIKTSLPSIHEELGKKIQDYLSLSQKTIQIELQHYLMNRSESTLQEFISGFETKISTIQTPIYALLQSNQEHITNRLMSVKEDMVLSKNTSERLYTEMSEYLNKFKVSSQFKGACSEKELHKLLSDMYTTDEIINTTGETASGDFIMKRNDEEYIMFENKMYENNVDKKEVEKFLRDSREKGLHSIMISQYSGIVGKPNYHIDITDTGMVLVYLHHVNYSCEIIKIAVDIIDNLSPKLKNITKQEMLDGFVIKKELLDKINLQMNTFIMNKKKMVAMIKDQQKCLLEQLDLFDLPDLSIFLSDKYLTNMMDFCCGICGEGFKSKSSLAAHKKVHDKDNVTDVYKMSMTQLKKECINKNINIIGKKKDEIVQLLLKND